MELGDTLSTLRAVLRTKITHTFNGCGMWFLSVYFTYKDTDRTLIVSPVCTTVKDKKHKLLMNKRLRRRIRTRQRRRRETLLKDLMLVRLPLLNTFCCVLCVV